MSEKSRSREYYDDFSATYEDRRHHGYHKLIDDLEVGIVKRYLRGGRVLEAGCGTGLILSRLGPGAVGLDLSPGMLSLARQRGLNIVQGSVDGLPFADDAFDTVVSFKVLPHVPAIQQALSDLARVTRPGGHLILEFYNRRSLRGLVKLLKRPTKISGRFHDENVFTRLDTLCQIRGYLPAGLELVDIHGVRVVTPLARFIDLPLVGAFLSRTEHLAAHAPLLRRYGGFLVVVLKKT